MARHSQPRGQMLAIKVFSVAAITVMSFAVSAHAGHVNAATARVNPPKVNVPNGSASSYRKPPIALGDGSVRLNRVFKPSYPSGPTQFPVGRLPMPSAVSAHAGQVRQPNLHANVPKTGIVNPPPPAGVRGGGSRHTRLLGLAVAPISHSRPHLRPLVRVPSAPVAH